MNALIIARLVRSGASDAEILEYADEARAQDREALAMAEWDCDDRRYIYGCGADDTVDSRGEKLRPKYNEAGEPFWM